MYKRKRIVIALGGNALGNTLPEQMMAVKTTAKALCDLIEDGHQVVVVHGNGPQVGMTNNATGSGMGTAGLVGQIMTWQTMVPAEGAVIVMLKIILLHFLLPGLLALFFCNCMRKLNWIKNGDMKLEV